ncbi:MAG TPA: AmmeMemoRadiSam system protein A [Vicinamibacteria bacterium]
MSHGAPGGELAAEEQAVLLRFARASAQAALTGGPKPRRPEGPGLESPRGAFVTLRRGADAALRGCVGLLEAERPLVDVVAHVAVAAALRDDRFDPVTAEELASLRIEISVLGPLFRVRPEEVVVGEMGLVVRARGRHGLLLPQVAVEQGFDRDTFLTRTCLKAGLPAAAWREAATEIHGFRCTVFGE